jgi:hypothetical protein
MVPVLLTRESEFEFKLSEDGLMRMSFQFRGAPRSGFSPFFDPPLDSRLFPSLISVGVLIIQFVCVCSTTIAVTRRDRI